MTGVLERIPRRVRAALAVVSAVAILLAAIGVGLRRDPLAFLFPFGRGPGLDYSARPHGYVPLDQNYVSDVLGELAADGVAAERLGGGLSTHSRSGGRSIVDPHPLTNDDIADARHVSSIPYTARTDASGATREPGEPTTVCGDQGGTVWYQYTAGDEGALVATLATDSAFPEGAVSLGVFKGEDLATVACDTDRGGRATVQVKTEPEVSYLFQIAGAGRFAFGLSPPPDMHLISANQEGERGNAGSLSGRVSGDGRIVVFVSHAGDIVPGSHNRNCWQEDPHQADAARTGFGLVGECPQILARNRATGEAVVVSMSSDGEFGNGASHSPDISADGRYVVFRSWATNLVPDDTNRVADILLHDLVTRKTERISVNSRGEQTLGASFEAHSIMPTISDDGNRISFASAAPNLVDGDLPGTLDVFVRDRAAGTTELVSAPLSANTATSPERFRDSVQTAEDTPLLDEYMLPCISPDGTMVAFKSHASDLVPGDTNGYADWFVRDLEAAVTERISVASDGTQGNDHAGVWAYAHALVRGNCFSADNRYVVFDSEASNLVAGDTNQRGDGFVHDRLTRTTTRVTVDPAGEEFPRESLYTTISRDGRWIAFLGVDAPLGPGPVRPTGTQVGPVAFEGGRPRGPHIYDMRTGEVEWIPLVSDPSGDGRVRTGDGRALDLSSDGRILTLDSAFFVYTEDSDHPSYYFGCRQEYDVVYEQWFGKGCVESSELHVYAIERWKADR